MFFSILSAIAVANGVLLIVVGVFWAGVVLWIGSITTPEFWRNLSLSVVAILLGAALVKLFLMGG